MSHDFNSGAGWALLDSRTGTLTYPVCPNFDSRVPMHDERLTKPDSCYDIIGKVSVSDVETPACGPEGQATLDNRVGKCAYHAELIALYHFSGFQRAAGSSRFRSRIGLFRALPRWVRDAGFREDLKVGE
ncbi:hypothetical protein RRG08_008359 [Elysia crispata]|uniref:Uncharacterized protein n=1 Tax=Elysia crispata TaxID=231223 RepID=A0AAE0YW92_9GAST|nr:hypothetical protein RRG08_008359 [Elysia crispata]